MANYSIKDLEKLSGIKAHTLRIWEKRYNLVEPMRTDTNIRYYNDEDLKRILSISMLNRNGTKISRIALFNEKEINDKILELTDNMNDSLNQIDNLVISMIELNEKKFVTILDASIREYGFEETVLNAIYPFFEKVGFLWQTGAINPAQEHFVSNLVRMKLCVAINNLSTEENSNSKSFLVFLPEGELHEIGLLFYYFLMKKYGHKVIYLGQSVPFEDIGSVQQIKSCDYLFTSFSSNNQGYDINAYIIKLSKTFRDKNILFYSYEFEGINKHFPKNVTRIQDPLFFLELLKSF